MPFLAKLEAVQDKPGDPQSGEPEMPYRLIAALAAGGAAITGYLALVSDARFWLGNGFGSLRGGSFSLEVSEADSSIAWENAEASGIIRE